MASSCIVHEPTRKPPQNSTRRLHATESKRKLPRRAVCEAVVRFCQRLEFDPRFSGEASEVAARQFHLPEPTIDRINILFGMSAEREAKTLKTVVANAPGMAREASDSVWVEAIAG